MLNQIENVYSLNCIEKLNIEAPSDFLAKHRDGYCNVLISQFIVRGDVTIHQLGHDF